MSGLPYGDSFGLTSIAFYTAFDVFSNKKRFLFIVVSVIPLALANWVNPLVSIHFFPVYLCIFVYLKQFRKEVVLLFTISSAIGLGFLGYGVEAGEIGGLSLPSFVMFKSFYSFLPLATIQLVSIPLLCLSKKNQATKYRLFYTFSSLLAWPIIFLISMLNHVKGNEYSSRYFIPVITISFVIQIIVLVDILASMNTRTLELPRLINFLKMKSHFMIIFFISGALLSNIILIPKVSKVFPLMPTWKKVNAKASQMITNPQFVIGDYWFSWPMKLFFPSEKPLPILSYRMEGQRIFLEKNRESLNYALGNGAKGICFGSVNFCQTFLDSIPGGNSFNQNLTLHSKEKLSFNGQEINIVQIRRETVKERCWNGSQLPSQIGIKSFTNVSVDIGKTGFLTFGPYVSLPIGLYTGTVEYKVGGEIGSVVGVVDLASATKPILGKEVNMIPSRIGRNTIDISFEASSQLPTTEIRVFNKGLTRLEINRVCIKKN